MTYERAKAICHVRSSIFQTSRPHIKYPKNHTLSLDYRIRTIDKLAQDWEEYDPREHAECSAYNEMPA
jgi:hypothetical protein